VSAQKWILVGLAGVYPFALCALGWLVSPYLAVACFAASVCSLTVWSLVKP
jgi:hypothetical protein